MIIQLLIISAKKCLFTNQKLIIITKIKQLTKQAAKTILSVKKSAINLERQAI